MTAAVGADRTSSVVRFRRRALAVVAGVLAVGMSAMVVVLAVAVPGATTFDLVLVAVSVLAHAAVARTVGRSWEPGGGLTVAYVLFNVALIIVGVSQAPFPASDAAWFLLAPIALAAITLSTAWQVAVTGLGIVGYLGASAIGPGISVGYVSQRSVAFVVFAVVMWFLTQRLTEALDAADGARAALQADVEEATSRNQELQRLDTARDDYVSSVSHELRTPLTVILGLAQTLEDHWDQLGDGQRRSMAQRLSSSARGLEGIVSALLDLTRIERGGLQPEVEPVRLATVVEDSVGRLSTVLRDHEVTTDVPVELVALTDGRLLERVLDNLLVNAARHTPAGTTVTVAARATDGRVRVEVADDGPGVAADDLARLGQQFFRAGDDPNVEGLGLGLALVVEVLRALGQELTVDSAPGEGTTFAFSLPLAGGADG